MLTIVKPWLVATRAPIYRMLRVLLRVLYQSVRYQFIAFRL